MEETKLSVELRLAHLYAALQEISLGNCECYDKRSCPACIARIALAEYKQPHGK